MAEDPVHFQMYGYGGFGYDTSHVPKDEPEPPITKKAHNGDLAGVRAIVKTTPANKKAQVINHARRWTEVDYRKSGFTKEYEWFDITPVAKAALCGHDQIVQYLLEQGADPTLVGCPSEDCHWDAHRCAEARVQMEESRCSEHPKFARALMSGKRCIDLLNAAKIFWKPAPYKGSRYDKNARKEFTNKPTNILGLLGALSAIPALPGDECSAAQARKKKPAAPSTSSAPSNGPTMKHICSQCKEQKSKSEFSKNQWSKGSYGGKCKNCIDSTKKPAAATVSTPAASNPVQRKLDEERREEEELGKMHDRLTVMSASTVLHLTKLSSEIEEIADRSKASYKCSDALRDSLETLQTAMKAAEFQLSAVSGMVHTTAIIAERDGRTKPSEGKSNRK